jgi:tetratricopeptide (TPR) repeat protein
VIELRSASRYLQFAALATATVAAIATPTSLLAFRASAMTSGAPDPLGHDPLAQANRYLQDGEADKALALLGSLPSSGPPAGIDQALAHNLGCRVHLTLEQWDAAANECDKAVHLDANNSDYHLWLARAIGQRAGHASFMNAFSLARKTRAEFEESVRLNPRNADALADLGEFYREAPGVIGGGIDKAQADAAQLDTVDPARAHHLRADIANGQKDFPTAEREFKQAISSSPHPALEWTSLASFYRHQNRLDEMESAVHSAQSGAARDRHAAVALFDGAGVLIEAKRNPALAAKMLADYLASPDKTEDAPAFVAHLRLAHLESQLGDSAGAARERAAALALAHDFKPAKE